MDKQIRGTVDLFFHRYPKKLLVIMPAHSQRPEIAAEQFRGILNDLGCASSKVVVLEGTGDKEALEVDATAVRATLLELGHVTS